MGNTVLIHTEFGKILRELRKEKGLTQVQLAKILGYTEASIRDWENRGIEPDFAILIKLTEIFDVTAGQLLGIEELII